MNLFWAVARNVTAVGQFESVHRFKTLRLRAELAGRIGERQVVFGGTRSESFSLRETSLDVSLRGFATPTALYQRGLRFGADVQIGGGVRVGDAFQAIVGFKLIAIWASEFCVEISQAGQSRPVRFEQEKYTPAHRRQRGRDVRTGLE